MTTGGALQARISQLTDLPPGTLRVHVLGCGSGYPTAERDTSSLLIGAPDGWTLVDCPGSVVHKLARLGVAPADLRRVILTHNHVDHVYGLPHLIHALAIAGRRDHIEVAAPRQTLGTVAAMMAAHGLEDARYPQVKGIEIALEEGAEIGAAAGTRIRAAPAAHGRDTVAVRFDAAEASVCHSSDTTPSVAVVRLARGADMLFHDCAGPHRLKGGFAASHSSAREAAEVAADAGVGTLVLMHLGALEGAVLEECVREAESGFSGVVILPHDGAAWVLPSTGG